MTFVFAYIATALAFFAADFLWLSIATPRLYRPQLATLLSDQPNFGVAAVFYAVYVVGIVVLAVQPAAAAKSLPMAIGLAALLGLVAYGTYDITNLATIRGWPLVVSLIDMAWGVCVTVIGTVAGFAALQLSKAWLG
jgi:uncharacterized membrane protein